MLRAIFDTNIYGFIAKEPKDKQAQLFTAINSGQKLCVYGFVEIRREIKRVEKWISWRINKAILNAYGLIVTKEYGCDGRIDQLAREYFAAYSALGGKKSWQELRVDLLTVACASIKYIDIIYSSDRETMAVGTKWSGACFGAYEKVNARHNLNLPVFLRYCELKKMAGIYEKRI